MNLKTYITQHLLDKDDAILDAINATTSQEKIAPKATDEIIKALDAAGVLDKTVIATLTSTTIVDHSIAFDDLGRLAELQDVVDARLAIVTQETEQLVRDVATNRINQLWAAIAAGKCTDDKSVIAEFSK